MRLCTERWWQNGRQRESTSVSIHALPLRLGGRRPVGGICRCRGAALGHGRGVEDLGHPRRCFQDNPRRPDRGRWNPQRDQRGAERNPVLVRARRPSAGGRCSRGGEQPERCRQPHRWTTLHLLGTRPRRRCGAVVAGTGLGSGCHGHSAEADLSRRPGSFPAVQDICFRWTQAL